jgi:hypothetical protein
MSVGSCITFIGLLTRRYIGQTPTSPIDHSMGNLVAKRETRKTILLVL